MSLRCGLARDLKAVLAGLFDAHSFEARGWKLWEDKNGWYLDQLKSHGMNVEEPSPALQAGLKKVSEQLTADWLKKAGPDGEAVIAAYKKM